MKRAMSSATIWHARLSARERIERGGRAQFHARDLPVRFDRHGDGVAEDGWFSVSYQPARDFDGKLSGVLTLSIDVTDRVRPRPA